LAKVRVDLVVYRMVSKQVVARIRSICWSNNCVDRCISELRNIIPKFIDVGNPEVFDEMCRDICGSKDCEHLLTKVIGDINRAIDKALLRMLGINI